MAVVAGVVDAEVGGDAVEPGAETGLGTIGLAGTVDAEEDLLGELFGDRLVVHHAVHEVNDRLAVLLEEEVEARHVAGAQLEHDGGVVHLAEVAGGDGATRRLEGCEQGRIDRQRSHIFHNPIFLSRLRLSVEFRGFSASSGQWGDRAGSFGSAGAGWLGGHLLEDCNSGDSRVR